MTRANTPYPCHLLLPRRLPGAEDVNAPLLGPETLGVEVTEPELAVRCGLGNLDPQHGGGGPGRCAIEAALTWPLPDASARLVTLRPDADAFGAMALLRHRKAGGEIGTDVLCRVEAVIEGDTFQHGDWQDWRQRVGEPAKLLTADDAIMMPEDYRAVTSLCLEDRLVEDRVHAVGEWLATGQLPSRARDQARAFAERLASAWSEGRVNIELIGGGQIAHLRSSVPGALSLAYRLAPVIVAEQEVRGVRKVTICQFSAGHVDLKAVADLLNDLESGWGGSDTLIGSPQGTGSMLALSDIVPCVMSCLLPTKAAVSGVHAV